LRKAKGFPLNSDVQKISITQIHPDQHTKEDIERESSHQSIRGETKFKIGEACLTIFEIKKLIIKIFEVGEDIDPKQHQKVIGN
jgi:hypothetical protein